MGGVYRVGIVGTGGIDMMIPPKITAKSTAASDVRISAIDGTAFIDNIPGGFMSAVSVGDVIEVYDSAGKFIRGYVGSVGSGETLGAAVFEDDCADDGTADWVATDSLAFDTDHYVLARNGTLMRARNTVVFTRPTAGRLMVLKMSVKDGTLTDQSLYIKTCQYSTAATLLSKTITTTSGFVENSFYSTSSNLEGFVGIQKDESVNGNIQLKLVSYAQVTAPSASGLVIVSTPGGATENWQRKDSGFAYNEASYGVVAKKYRG